MVIFCDIDGTLTDAPGAIWGQPNWPLITRIKEAIQHGHRVILWSISGEVYVKDFAKRHGIEGAICVSKPNVVIDDNPKIIPGMIHLLPQEALIDTSWYG